MFLSLFIFRGHPTREPASSRVTYFILRAYTGNGVSHSQHRKKSEEVLEKMRVNGAEGKKRSTISFSVLFRRFNKRKKVVEVAAVDR